MTWNWSPPILTPWPQSMTESSGWNLRLARLKGSETRCTRSTTSIDSSRNGSIFGRIAHQADDRLFFTPARDVGLQAFFLDPADDMADGLVTDAVLLELQSWCASRLDG